MNRSKYSWDISDNMHVEFDIIEPDWIYTPQAGVIIFAKEISEGTWEPLFVDQSDNIANLIGEIEYNEIWSLACELRATHIHVHLEKDTRKREHITKRLLSRYNPPITLPEQR